MLTQCVQMTGKNIFEFEKKNLLIASKAPQCIGGVAGAESLEPGLTGFPLFSKFLEVLK